MTSTARTIFDKIWDEHVVAEEAGNPAVLYIDLHLVHEVTSPQAFQGLRDRGLSVRRPLQTMGTLDHSIPTTPPDVPITDEMAARQIAQMESNCREFGIPLHTMTGDTRGIVHVIGPELGLSQPGMTIVCGDSHTSTHGAFGALAFGIGTSEVEHVLASQCLLQTKPLNCQVRVEGQLGEGVTAKDIILRIDGKKVTTLEQMKAVHEDLIDNVETKHRVQLVILRGGLMQLIALDFQRDYERD